MAERIADAELTELSPSGHLSVFEQDEALMAAIDGFARRLHERCDAIAITGDASPDSEVWDAATPAAAGR
ncbi:MAG: hypothetical protein M3295_05170 [Chloroflexota bacterium]|nr:hypothetical protein [Chloroflexota bacterium]